MLSCLCNNCHVVIFAETMEFGRDEEQEQVLGDIILAGGDVMSYLNDNDGLEAEQGEEEAGYSDRRVEEERHDYDGSSDPMLVQDEARGDGSGDRTESVQVNILVVLVCTHIN